MASSAYEPLEPGSAQGHCATGMSQSQHGKHLGIAFRRAESHHNIFRPEDRN